MVLREVPDAQFVLGGVGELEKLGKLVSVNHFKFLGWIEGEKKKEWLESRVPIKQYLQKFPKWGRFGVTSVTPFLLLPVHPEGCTPARRT